MQSFLKYKNQKIRYTDTEWVYKNKMGVRIISYKI